MLPHPILPLHGNYPFMRALILHPFRSHFTTPFGVFLLCTPLCALIAAKGCAVSDPFLSHTHTHKQTRHTYSGKMNNEMHNSELIDQTMAKCGARTTTTVMPLELQMNSTPTNERTNERATAAAAA